MFSLNRFILSFFILFSLESLASELKFPSKISEIRYVQGEKELLEVSGESLDKIEQYVVGEFAPPEDIWKKLTKLHTISEIQASMKLRDTLVQELPILILKEKLSKAGILDHLQRQTQKEQVDLDERYEQIARRGLYHAIHETHPSDSIIDLAERLRYNQGEKLNLFMYLLHQKDSDALETHEILKLFSKWNIDKYMEAFVLDHSDFTMDHVIAYLQFRSNSRQLFIKDKPITTVWHELVLSQRYDVFVEILNRYPHLNINTQDILGRSILHLISSYNLALNKKFFDKIVEHGRADFHLTNIFSYTPFMAAIAHNSPLFEEFMKLPSYQIGLEMKDYFGRTPAFLASELGLHDKVQALYDKGAVFQYGVMSQLNVFIDDENLLFEADYPMNFEFESLSKYIKTDKYLHDPSKNQLIPIYSYLFEFSKALLHLEENKRKDLLMGLLSGYASQELEQETPTAGKLFKAVRVGNVRFLKTFFSHEKNQQYLHNHFFKKSFNKYLQFSDYFMPIQVALNLEIQNMYPFLPRDVVKFKNLVADGFVLLKAQGGIQGLTLLSEAVRFNQDDVVEFLMDQGAQIASGHRSISYMLQNELVIGVLNGQFVYNSPYRFKVYQNIIERLVQDPQVTKSFLEAPIFFGLSLTDLAAIRGNLFALKLFYKKGARVSKNLGVWGSPHLTLSIVAQDLEHYKVAIFIEQENLKKNPANKNREEFIKLCQLAFH